MIITLLSTVKTLTRYGVVTASLTPGGTSFPFSAQRCRETVGKLVAVVAKKVIIAKFTFVVFGTALDAFDTQFAVSGRGFLHFPFAFVSHKTLSRIVSIRITFYIKINIYHDLSYTICKAKFSISNTLIFLSPLFFLICITHS